MDLLYPFVSFVQLHSLICARGHSLLSWFRGKLLSPGLSHDYHSLVRINHLSSLSTYEKLGWDIATNLQLHVNIFSFHLRCFYP